MRKMILIGMAVVLVICMLLFGCTNQNNQSSPSASMSYYPSGSASVTASPSVSASPSGSLPLTPSASGSGMPAASGALPSGSAS